MNLFEWVFQRRSDPRLFVELLFRATAFYANPPSSHLELGDYGEVSKATGEFIKSGNLLEDYPELKKLLGEAKQTPEDRKHFFAARTEGTAVGHPGVPTERYRTSLVVRSSWVGRSRKIGMRSSL